MLMEERHQKILEVLHRNGKVLSSELTKTFDVSEDTIRRDLRILASKGLIHRVHKGALPPSADGISYGERKASATNTSQAMLGRALNLLEEGDHIFLDGGTTNETFASLIPEQLNLTVITNSPPTAIALANKSNAKVIMPEGTLLREAMVLVGPEVIRLVQQTQVKKYYIGLCSLHMEAGITCGIYEDAQVKRSMIHHATQVIALASPNKLGTVSSFQVASADSLTHLIVENDTSPMLLKPFEDLGVTTLLA